MSINVIIKYYLNDLLESCETLFFLGLIMSLEKDLVEPLKVMKAAVDAVA